MQPAISYRRKPTQSVGDYISHEYYQYLVKGYDQQHPTEQKSVFVPKDYILETLGKFQNVSGLRFMYGLREGADPSSRTIVLMACNDTSTDKAIPNLILIPNDYLTDKGERLTLDQCWDLFNRYANRMCELMPAEARKDIPRSCFLGISTLIDLLNIQNCTGILFHFGYNPAKEALPERYAPVLEAVDEHLQSLDIFVDQLGLCPPTCSPPVTPAVWPFTALL